MRKLIAPFNWHRDGYCRFPVLCMYDDMLIWELDGISKRRATWRRAKAYRRDIDNAIADYVRRQMPDDPWPPIRPQNPSPPVNVPPPPVPRPPNPPK